MHVAHKAWPMVSRRRIWDVDPPSINRSIKQTPDLEGSNRICKPTCTQISKELHF